MTIIILGFENLTWLANQISNTSIAKSSKYNLTYNTNGFENKSYDDLTYDNMIYDDMMYDTMMYDHMI